MDRIQRSSINMLSSAAGYVLPMLVTLITTPILLHLLGEEAYGLQSLVAVVIGYLFFMDMGLDLPIIKLLAEDRAKQDAEAESNLLSTTIQLYVLIGLVGMILIVLLSKLLVQHVFSIPSNLVDSALLVFRLAGVGFLGSIFMSWGRAVSMGLQRFDISYSVSLVNNIAGTLIGLGVVYAGFGVVGYIFIRVILSIFAGLAYWLLASSLVPEFHFRWGFHRKTLHRIKGYVGYGLINRVTGSLFSRIDQTLIAVWVGVAAAGIYAVSFMLVNSVSNMISYMLGFIFPMTSELQSLGQFDRMREIFVRSARFNTALAGLLFSPIFVLGDLFLLLWVPSIAVQASQVIQLLALAAYLAILCASMTNNVLIGMGYMREFTIYINIRGVVLGVLCVLLIKPFGMKGAGWALLLTEIVDIVYLLIVLRSFLHIPAALFFQSAYIKPMAITGVLCGLYFLARPFADSWIGFGVTVGISSIFYVGMGFWLGVFGDTEKQALQGLWRLAVQRMKGSNGSA